MLVESAFNYYNSIKLHFSSKNKNYDCFKYHFSIRRRFDPKSERYLRFYQSVAERASTVTKTANDEILYFFATFRKNPKAFINEFAKAQAAKNFVEYKFLIENALPVLYRDFLRDILKKIKDHNLKNYYMIDDEKGISLMYEDLIYNQYIPELFILHNKIFGCIEKTNDELLKHEYNMFPKKFEPLVIVDVERLEGIIKETLAELKN
nr:MAG TPA: HELICASE ASSEMBLY Protein [Caudoviricetes sp.]